MTENLIPSYLDDNISYLEQDGKLYCQLSHKGCGDTYREEASKFTIDTINENTIISNAILVSETCGTE